MILVVAGTPGIGGAPPWAASTITYRSSPDATYAWTCATVGTGSDPLNPPIPMTGSPDSSSSGPSSSAEATATIQ